MSINDILRAYMDNLPLDEILEMYKECDLNERDDFGGSNLLHVASRHAHPEAIAFLIESGLKPNDPNNYKELPLSLLASNSPVSNYKPQKGNIYKSAKILLENKANPNKKDSRDLVCYLNAASCGNHEFLKALADEGIKLNKRDMYGNTALHLVAQNARTYVENVEREKERLEDKKNEINLPAKWRSQVTEEEIERAIAREEERLNDFFLAASVLMNAGLDPEDENHNLETASKLAERAYAKKLAALLTGAISFEDSDSEEAEAKISSGGMSLHQAVLQNDTKAVSAIISLGADVNAFDDDKFENLTPLAVACKFYSLEAAQVLFENGADANLKSGTDNHPLSYMFTDKLSIHQGMKALEKKLPVKMIRLFCDNGFDINETLDQMGNTLLHYSCGSPYNFGEGEQSLKYLVAHEAISQGADVNIKSYYGQTPLMQACIQNYRVVEPIIQELLDEGAEVDHQDQSGNTALHFAAYNSNNTHAYAIAEMLFDNANPDATVVNDEGKTALDYATEANNTTLVKLLLSNM